MPFWPIRQRPEKKPEHAGSERRAIQAVLRVFCGLDEKRRLILFQTEDRVDQQGCRVTRLPNLGLVEDPGMSYAQLLVELIRPSRRV